MKDLKKSDEVIWTNPKNDCDFYGKVARVNGEKIVVELEVKYDPAGEFEIVEQEVFIKDVALVSDIIADECTTECQQACDKMLVNAY